MARLTLARWLRALLNFLSKPSDTRPATPQAGTAAFSPTRAQSASRHIIGRQDEAAHIINALLEEHAHVALFSERGRGKTSLTNLVVELLRERGMVVARYTCEAGDEFDAMLRGLLRTLPRSMLPRRLRRAAGEGCEALLPDRALRASDAVALTDALRARIVFVVDEFDRTRDLATRTRIADTMKSLSDRGADLHFLLVAVSATVEEVLGEHPSVQRNLIALHLPLLADADIRTMLLRGGNHAGIAFTEDAIALVIQVARGMPYVAQLLGLRIAQATLRRDGETVTLADQQEAVHRLIEETTASAKAIYAALRDVPHEDMADVLHHLSGAEQNSLGAMALEEGDLSVKVGGVAVSRNAYALLTASGVLAQALGGSGTVHVQDRNVMVYVLLLAARDWLGRERKVEAA